MKTFSVNIIVMITVGFIEIYNPSTQFVHHFLGSKDFSLILNFRV